MDGCFIACLAMFLGKSYVEAFKALYPGQDPNGPIPQVLTSVDLMQAVTDTLKKLGFTVKRSSYRKLQSLRKYSRKNAILIIRWQCDDDSDEVSYSNPWLCHAVVFDAETKKFIDPSHGHATSYEMKSYQRQLDSILYVEPAQAA